MTIAENSLSTSTTLDGKAIALAGVPQAFAEFLERCDAKYGGFVLDEAWYADCCQEAIMCGIPMDGKYSIRPYVAANVALTTTAYGHLPDRATRMWICLIFSIIICIDDDIGGELDMEHLRHFNERFLNCQPQGDPVLKALDTFLRQTHRHYSPLVSNLSITSLLDYISSIILDHETKDMQISTKTPLYPMYSRLLSGFPHASALFIFPPTIPVVEYIQSMPYMGVVTDYVNDILSFYKEEIKGDTQNYVSLFAASHAITKLDALHEVIDQTIHAHHTALESLKGHTEAYEAYDSYFHGFIRFHFPPRYKLEEIM